MGVEGELNERPAHELVQEIKRVEVKARDLTDAVLDTIDRQNDTIMLTSP